MLLLLSFVLLGIAFGLAARDGLATAATVGASLGFFAAFSVYALIMSYLEVWPLVNFSSLPTKQQQQQMQLQQFPAHQQQEPPQGKQLNSDATIEISGISTKDRERHGGIFKVESKASGIDKNNINISRRINSNNNTTIRGPSLTIHHEEGEEIQLQHTSNNTRSNMDSIGEISFNPLNQS